MTIAMIGAHAGAEVTCPEILPGELHDLAALNAAISDRLMRVDLSAPRPESFRARFAMETCAGVALTRIVGPPMSCRSEAGDGRRNRAGLMLAINRGGAVAVEQNGRRVVIGPSDFVVIATRLPLSYASAFAQDFAAVVVPEALVAGNLGSPDRLAGAILPGDTAEAQLLAAYLFTCAFPVDPAMKALIGRHLADLAVAALARALRLDDLTEARGIRAARLGEIRRIIEERLDEPMLNAVRVARQIGVTDRYVQKLFEEAGTTFSAHMLERRLLRARQRLADPAHAGRTIQDIAWASGFSNASHFNRAFRRRFGETPTSVRGRTGGLVANG